MKKMLTMFSMLVFVLTVSTAFAVDGAAIYKSCAGCHGTDGSKPTSGSLALKGQTADAIAKKLMGYADGSFGGAQKAMMQRLAKKLSPEEIQAVAAHIATF